MTEMEPSAGERFDALVASRWNAQDGEIYEVLGHETVNAIAQAFAEGEAKGRAAENSACAEVAENASWEHSEDIRRRIAYLIRARVSGAPYSHGVSLSRSELESRCAELEREAKLWESRAWTAPNGEGWREYERLRARLESAPRGYFWRYKDGELDVRGTDPQQEGWGRCRIVVDPEEEIQHEPPRH